MRLGLGLKLGWFKRFGSGEPAEPDNVINGTDNVIDGTDNVVN